MRKKLHFLKIVLFAAFLVPFVPMNAQNNSDTITSQYPEPTSLSVMPGYYAYTLSACLYTADEINHQEGNIYSLSYNIAPSNGYDYGYSSAKIYLLETGVDHLDLERSWNDMISEATLVYDGSLSDIAPFDIYWHEFTFIQPFEYGGGNLIVMVEGICDDGSATGGTDYEIGLYCNEGNDGNCWIVMQDYEAFSLDDEMASLNGSYHSNTEYRPDIFFTFTGSQGNCSLTIPYFEDFEDYDGNYSALPECWTRISEEYNSSLNYYTPIIGPAGGSSAGQNLFFSLMSTYSEFAILPELDEGLSVQDLTMTFDYRTSQQFATGLVVGVMTNPDDTTTFVGVDTVYRIGTAFDFEGKEVNFASYDGEGRHIAFCFTKSVSSLTIPSCFVDNVHISSVDAGYDTVFVNIDTAVCSGEVVTVGNSEFSESGEYSVVVGDTIFHLVLAVNPIYNIVISDSIEEGQVYAEYGFNVSTSGTYTQNLQTVNGCDSLITLVLSTYVGVRHFNDEKITVRPNPAVDYFDVVVENTVEAETYVDLLDISGRILRSERMHSGDTVLRIRRGSLPSGIYMLRLSSDGHSQTRKVIFK